MLYNSHFSHNRRLWVVRFKAHLKVGKQMDRHYNNVIGHCRCCNDHQYIYIFSCFDGKVHCCKCCCFLWCEHQSNLFKPLAADVADLNHPDKVLLGDHLVSMETTSTSLLNSGECVLGLFLVKIRAESEQHLPPFDIEHLWSPQRKPTYAHQAIFPTSCEEILH